MRLASGAGSSEALRAVLFAARRGRGQAQEASTLMAKTCSGTPALRRRLPLTAAVQTPPQRDMGCSRHRFDGCGSELFVLLGRFFMCLGPMLHSTQAMLGSECFSVFSLLPYIPCKLVQVWVARICSFGCASLVFQDRTTIEGNRGHRQFST